MTDQNLSQSQSGATWNTKDGKQFSPSEMATPYLRNAINMARQEIESGKAENIDSLKTILSNMETEFNTRSDRDSIDTGSIDQTSKSI